jgi:basic amino acid/polyamine antiporter, APA family
MENRSTMFVRRSSGLVREASVLDAAIFNAVFSAPVGATLAFGTFYALAAFPGADLVLALLIAFAANLPVCVLMSMMASAMPRTGGDYVWISRILHPGVAVFSNFAATVSALIGAAFWARSFAALVLGPALAVLGAVTGTPWLVEAGHRAGTAAWTLALGTLLILLLAVAMSLGNRAAFRIQNVCWIIASAGTFLAFAALLFGSRPEFISRFNRFASSFTGATDSYEAIQQAAAAAGYGFTGGHVFSATFPAVAVMMTFMMWNWWSVYIAGELKSAANLRRQLTIMIGALAWDTLFMIVGILLLYRAAGEQFIAAINFVAGRSTGYTLPVQPWYNLMASISAGGGLFSVLIAVSFVFWNLPAMFPNTFMPVRTIFAWAFDGVLPDRLSDVNERTHTPVRAIIVVSAIVLGILIWSVTSSSFFTLLSMGVLAGMITVSAVSVTAILFPYRRPELFRNSPAGARLFGVSILQVAALASLAVMGVFAYVLLSYPQLGISGPLQGLSFVAALVLLGLAIFYVARRVRMSQGINLNYIYQELPPE